MDEKSLGQQLQNARKAAGLTQQQLCHHANLSFSTLTKIERGAIKAPSIFTIQAIAGALNLSLDELLGGMTPILNQPARNLHKSKSGVSFVYFDVNGCLVHFYQRAFAKMANDINIPSDLVETAFWHFNDEVCRGTLTLDEFNKKLADRLGVASVDWQKYYLETVEPIQPMQDLLVAVSERYKVGLLTNIMPGFLNIMRHHKQLPDIVYDAVTDSSEVGAIKPEDHMFEIAQAKAGVPPEEILLIDDSRVNLMAAEKLGWHTLWFDDARAEESTEAVIRALEPAT
jgi:FMN phosphatase YigB (HAD superfamily)/DNA-binding XRE family transcriptional regulator